MKDIEHISQNQELSELLLTAFQAILDTTQSMIFVKDLNFVYCAASTSFAEMTGHKSPADIIGLTDYELFEDQELADHYVSDDKKLLASDQNMLNYTEPLSEENGLTRYAITSKYILRDHAGIPIGIAGVSRDITAEYIIKQNHQKELDYLYQLPNDTYFSVLIDVTDWKIVGERRQTVNGYEFQLHDTIETLSEKASLRIVDRRWPAYAFYHDFSAPALRKMYESGKMNIVLEYRRLMSDDSMRWVRDELKFLTDPFTGHLCIMLVVRDIHSKKEAEQILIQRAERDALTGLLNRSSAMRFIQDIISENNPNIYHALFIIDADNFKQINDTFGHKAGDHFLIQFAQAIQNCFRSTDIVSRLGGDEFFVLMKQTPTRLVVEEKAQDLLTALQAVCDNQSGVHVSGSIGISCYPHDGKTLDALYERADQALYHAKRTGKNRVVFAQDLPQ